MVFYFDNAFPEKLVKAIRLIYSFGSASKVEIIRGDWNMVAGTDEVVVFLIDYAARGIDVNTTKYVEDGYKVFAFKRTKDSGFTIFSMSFTLLAAWRNILEKIEEEPDPFVYTIHNDNTRLYSVSVN